MTAGDATNAQAAASRREVLGCLPAAALVAAGLPGVAGAESLSPMDGEYSASTGSITSLRLMQAACMLLLIAAPLLCLAFSLHAGGFRKITVVPMGFTVGYYMALITSKTREDASFGAEQYVKIRDPNGGANPALSRTLLQTKLFPGDNEGTYSDGTITFKDGSKWSKLAQ